ncbi:MAG TPA: ribonuclease E activity regulator RraA [Sandaracinaceae bacterium LLY-WYZ-13_1]|nr:ribonuclease E activity regulator RraA [Sandaracinaceae bacterium LLY-WYZ-13_1]
MDWTTADLYDAHEGEVQVAEGRLLAFGRRTAFAGPIATVKVHEDNPLVKETLRSPGEGRVLVVDGGGSLRTALLGDKLAGFGVDHGWAGVVIWGCIRDSAEIDRLDIGVRCLATTPRRSSKHGFGERDVVVRFANIRFDPGAWLYADEDGILVSDTRIDAE